MSVIKSALPETGRGEKAERRERISVLAGGKSADRAARLLSVGRRQRAADSSQSPIFGHGSPNVIAHGLRLKKWKERTDVRATDIVNPGNRRNNK